MNRLSVFMMLAFAAVACEGRRQTTCDPACDATACQICERGTCVSLCTEGQVCSGGQCVVDTTCHPACDPADCEVCDRGACKTTCAANQVCDSGTCKQVCDPACDPDLCEACVDGTCESTCSLGQVCDSGTCVADTSCNSACDAGECKVCVQGNCESACSLDQVCDSGTCVANNSCNPACDAGKCKVCVDGNCTSTCIGEEVCLSGQCQAGLTVYDIQNTESPAHPPAGTEVNLGGVVVTGIFTRSNQTHFWVEELGGGPWSGIYIYNKNSIDVSQVARGARVNLSGVYTEYYELSEIELKAILVDGTGVIPAPAVVAPADLATGGSRAEEFEGVLVEVQNVTVENANPDAPNNYNEFVVTGGLRVDDEAYLIAPDPVVGNAFESLTGVLHFGFGNFKLEPRDAQDVVPLEICDPACDAAQCEVCRGGACVSKCEVGETCGAAGACVPDTSCDPACDAALCEACSAGQCISTCSEGEVCEAGSCVLPNICEPACDANLCQICENRQCVSACGGGEVCDNGQCVPDVCTPACDANLCQICENRQCVSACTLGELCQGGQCVADTSCNPACDAGLCQVCVVGECKTSCGVGQACVQGACMAEVTIYDLQDVNRPGHPAVDSEVLVRGAVVTAFHALSTSPTKPRFWIQDPAGGPYSGIYVFNSAIEETLALGSEVDVVGVYKEFNGLSELLLNAVTVRGSALVPEPAVVEPGDVASPSGVPGPLAEEYEGVLIRVENVRVQSSNPDGPAYNYGEIEVTGGLRVDDEIWPDLPQEEVGIAFQSLTGVLHYAFSNFKLEPRDANDVVLLAVCDPACDAAQCEVCRGGVCVSKCEGGQICDNAGTCVADVCEPACDANLCLACENRQCVSACSEGQVCDSGQCVADVCDPACDASLCLACENRQCVSTCSEGQVCDNAGTCVADVCEPTCDANLCLACENRECVSTCSEGEVCDNAGTCVPDVCEPACDANLCLACENRQCVSACTESQLCQGGQCVATVCEPVCDAQACEECQAGQCVSLCGAGEECQAGQCVPVCEPVCDPLACMQCVAPDVCESLCVGDEVCDGAGQCEVPCTGTIAEVRAADGTLSSPLCLDAVRVTYVRPTVQTSSNGYTIQKDPTGPAVFVTTGTNAPTVAVGNRLRLSVTAVANYNGLKQATGTIVANDGLAGSVDDLVQDFSLGPAIDEDAESELVLINNGVIMSGSGSSWVMAYGDSDYSTNLYISSQVSPPTPLCPGMAINVRAPAGQFTSYQIAVYHAEDILAADDTGCTKDIGDCRLQAPAAIAGLAGETAEVTGRLHISGLTDTTSGNDPWPSVQAQLGYGPDGSTPDVSWAWTSATPDPTWVDTEELDFDQYSATLTLPGPAGSPYDYAYRVSGDAGLTWTLCDLDGALNGYDPAQAGDLQVTGGSELGLILSEVFYDALSGDDQLEWVELYNGTDNPIDLSSYSLGNGGLNYTFSKVQLQGVIPSRGCAVIGGPLSNDTNFNPVFTLAIDFNLDFQNSGNPADGVALFSLPAAQVTATTVPLDAVIYGTANGSNLLDETGQPGAVDVGNCGPAKSIERTVTGWRIQAAPTPNICGPF